MGFLFTQKNKLGVPKVKRIDISDGVGRLKLRNSVKENAVFCNCLLPGSTKPSLWERTKSPENKFDADNS